MKVFILRTSEGRYEDAQEITKKVLVGEGSLESLYAEFRTTSAGEGIREWRMPEAFAVWLIENKGFKSVDYEEKCFL